MFTFEMSYGNVRPENVEKVLTQHYGSLSQFTFYTKSGKVREVSGIITYTIPEFCKGMCKMESKLGIADVTGNFLTSAAIASRYVKMEITTIGNCNPDVAVFLDNYAKRGSSYHSAMEIAMKVSTEYAGDFREVMKYHLEEITA